MDCDEIPTKTKIIIIMLCLCSVAAGRAGGTIQDEMDLSPDSHPE